MSLTHRHRPLSHSQPSRLSSLTLMEQHSCSSEHHVTPILPSAISLNSEPVESHQPSNAAQPTYEHTITPAAAPVPREVPHDFSSPQYPVESQEINASDLMSRDRRSHPRFRHSQCTGRRKALCIGIDYYDGQGLRLNSCVNDARNVYRFLIEKHRYTDSHNIVLLTDDNSNPDLQPTRKNILKWKRWLVEGARADDFLFVHFSGHGIRKKDVVGDELDGLDECIYPADVETLGHPGSICDNELHDTLVGSLPPGCRLTALFDCCHSGSILDLNYEFHYDGQEKPCSVTTDFQKEKSTPADVLCFSACSDDQQSFGTNVEGEIPVGAMSSAFLEVLKANSQSESQITYIDLLRGVREIVSKKYVQEPQLSASHKVESS
ncbi:caspase domain-containing protein [Russula vinacea]|nr:caspase domain-containing protein [Russula vinacea]